MVRLSNIKPNPTMSCCFKLIIYKYTATFKEMYHYKINHPHVLCCSALHAEYVFNGLR